MHRLVASLVVMVTVVGSLQADALTSLSRRYGDRRAWLAAHGIRDLAPCPLIVVNERYRVETRWFSARLYDLADYRYQEPIETSITVDPGLPGPADPRARYGEIDESLRIVAVGDDLAVVSRSCPLPRKPWRRYTRLKPPAPSPPEVLIGTLDESGTLVPTVRLPAMEDGWSYVCDPFRLAVVRINDGGRFPPPPGLSEGAWTVSADALPIVDREGRALRGGRLAEGLLPGQPDPVLVVEHEGTRMAVGSAGPRERALARHLRSLPGRPLGVDRIEFPREVFRADRLAVRGGRLELLLGGSAPSTLSRAPEPRVTIP